MSVRRFVNIAGILAAFVVFFFYQGPAGICQEEKKAEVVPDHIQKDILKAKVEIYRASVAGDRAELESLGASKRFLIGRGARVLPADKETARLKKDLAKLRSEFYRLKERVEVLRRENEQLHNSLK